MPNKFWRITLDTNPEDCNLNCLMCEEHSDYSDFKQKLLKKSGLRRRRMPLEWIVPILQEAKDLGVTEIIPTTMGDPLVSPHFELIATEVMRLGLKLNLTHNGTFPRKTVEEWAKIIVPITSDIKISWNGASSKTAEFIMKGVDFQKNIANLRQFIHYRNEHFNQTGYYCRLTFQLTFMQNNMHEIADIVQLAAELGIDRIKGHHLWVHFTEIEHLAFTTSAESIEKWNQIVEIAYEAIEKFRKPNGEKIVLDNFYFISEILPKNTSIPESYECPFLEKELWISAEGKISPCCAPDEQRNSLGDFGYYPQTTINKVLTSEKYQNLVKNFKNFELCQNCRMRKPKPFF